ncbi:hypothetical protein QOZ80_7BG0611570 [Eleusine coracana subsp. coracana]|nr:hypothetical protein QOZ80_7BG0611570 [Eleusine coracana subsp. coracana]
MFDEDEGHSFPEEIGAHGSNKELRDCNIEKGLNGHVTAKELTDCLKEQIEQSSLNQVVSYSTDQELNPHNNMEGFNSSGFRNEVDDHACVKEPDNQNNLKRRGSYMTETELNNHSFVNELVIDANLKELNGHNSGEELDAIESSKFAAEEKQCLKELDSFNSLNLDNNSVMEEFDNPNCPKESGNNNSSTELDNNRSPKFESTDDIKLASAAAHSGGFLAEHFNNIRISETGSGKESCALQPKDDSEKSVPPEHDVDLQVLVTL